GGGGGGRLSRVARRVPRDRRHPPDRRRLDGALIGKCGIARGGGAHESTVLLRIGGGRPLRDPGLGARRGGGTRGGSQRGGERPHGRREGGGLGTPVRRR